ncbi:baseplate J/gp47 family protein [Kutzneria sp. NPDC052558]|uniref:baseplate J/gp47 family protein n=1 Tax=Kutzneria sp. NPDC052558 TaxID=3364121 RepID=UPI0037C6C393
MTIDPGHPFTISFPDLVDALQERVRDGVEQPAATGFVVSANATSYELPAQTAAVTQVAGTRHGAYGVFTAGVDYQLRGNRLVWTDAANPPDPGSRLDVDYTYRDAPAGLTDFNTGSVISTLLRAVAHEMSAMYAQMDQAYRRGFIDEATGVALDNVVALLGVQRKAALPAKGVITFYRKRITDARVSIPAGARVADRAGRTFATTAAAGIDTTLDELAIPGPDHTLRVANRIGQLTGVWPRDADPATTPPLPASTGTNPRTVTVQATGELRVRYRPLSVDVAVQAITPGPDGNAAPDTVVVMPTPPSGVDGVTNEAAFTGGERAESDDQLRERAKHALERAGNATLDAIRFAVLGVSGVTGVTVTDHSGDESIPLGQVWVRWAGDDEPAVAQQVLQTVDRTRAAGVVARVERIGEVTLAGAWYVLPSAADGATAGAAQLLKAFTDALAALPIGEPLSLRRLAALAYGRPGLEEVAETALAFTRPDATTGPVTDPFLVGPTEVIRPTVGRLAVVVIDRLAVTAAGAVITVTLLDQTGQAVPLSSFGFDLMVTVKAPLKATTTATPVLVGRHAVPLAFTAAHSASFTLKPADFGYNTTTYDPHLTVELALAAFPGVAGTSVAVTAP